MSPRIKDASDDCRALLECRGSCRGVTDHFALKSKARCMACGKERAIVSAALDSSETNKMLHAAKSARRRTAP